VFSRNRAMMLIAAAALCAACTKSEPERKQELTQREKDSVFARSRVPGARAVNKALQTADSASARGALIDSASQAP
jgi:hypothetical protein